MRFRLVHWLVVVSIVSLLIASGGCRPSPSVPPSNGPQGPVSWRYTVAVEEDLARFWVQLCFDGPPPRFLVARGGAMDFLASATGPQGPLERHQNALVTENLGDDACIDYGVDAAKMADRGRYRATRVGRDLIATSDLWLWRPAEVAEGAHATLTLQMPPGMRASLPWPRSPAKGVSYALDETAFSWRANTAFGYFSPIVIEAAGARFDIAVLDSPRRASDEGLATWISTAAKAVAQVYGDFPRDRVQVIVLPRPARSDEPVLFGMTARGGGAGLIFLVPEDTRDEDLPGEWISVHEMLHLGMPFLDAEGKWMAEGFVTYYTQVVRARAGLYPVGPTDDAQVASAVYNLWDGFRRGRGTGTHTLAERSKNMARSRAYERVYWGGAAVALDLDLRLRRATDGRQNLDDLMVKLRRCCTSQPKRWSASELLEVMEGSVRRRRGRPVVSPKEIAAKHLENTVIPAPQAELRGLAIELSPSGPALESSPRGQARLRSAILAPR